MTIGPDDLAAIRAEWEPMHYVDGRRERVLALCDALEAAWAEARDTEIDVDALCLTLATERERAEALEAELATLKAAVPQLSRRAHRAEAALARVRALCDGWNAAIPTMHLAETLLRALDGEAGQ